ncbi:hypothetical protein AB0Y20_01100 [Heyndrickxia oleronia]|uniref:hypothetical protein n=1 Tax=Heyndrickxia oleronia TaxID=38875 RepID=UPI003F271BA8
MERLSEIKTVDEFVYKLMEDNNWTWNQATNPVNLLSLIKKLNKENEYLKERIRKADRFNDDMMNV